jgi:DNA-binding GntR family transcriptional regulator
MSPNYANRQAPDPHRVPDWMLGGHRRRVILQALATGDGCNADALASEADIGRSTVFEMLRALRAIGAIARSPDGAWRLDTDTALGAAINDLLAALAPLDGHVVDRPPRARDR